MAGSPRDGSARAGRPLKALFVTSNRVGDAILSTGILNRIIEDNPGIAVTVACGPVAVSLFEACPQVAAVIAMPKARYGLHWFRLWRRCVGTYWDIVVDLRGSALSWLLPRRRAFVLRPSGDPVHRVEMLARVIRAADVPEPRVWTGERQEGEAAKLLPERPILALGPTANWGGKQWPADRFLDVARRLTKDDGPLPGAKIAVFGAAGERPMAAPLFDGLPRDGVVDLIGRTDLPTAAACLKRCALFVGNDSGLMHLAAASGIPTLGLFGPSPERHYAPWGRWTAFVRTPESFEEIVGAPDYDYRSQESRMTSLTVDRVFAAARNLLEKRDRMQT